MLLPSDGRLNVVKTRRYVYRRPNRSDDLFFKHVAIVKIPLTEACSFFPAVFAEHSEFTPNVRTI